MAYRASRRHAMLEQPTFPRFPAWYYEQWGHTNLDNKMEIPTPRWTAVEDTTIRDHRWCTPLKDLGATMAVRHDVCLLDIVSSTSDVCLFDI